MKDCCNHSKKDKKCKRKSDKKIFKLPRKYTKKKCKKPKGFTMRSSCAPYKDCHTKKQRGGKRNKSIIYFSLGCFWGIESKLSKLKGVITTSVGYMGGHTLRPTYKKVLNGDTGHAETVKIVFNSRIISLSRLLEKFKKLNKDRGNYDDKNGQYRSAIFCETEKQKKEIDKLKLGVEVKANVKFHLAEQYHQRYNDKKTKIMTENLDEFNRICLNNKDKAEEKGKGKYYSKKYKTKKGIYKCALCKNNLYHSKDMFDSGSGWPAFYDTIDGYESSEVVFHKKLTKELTCMKCGIHLGHRFKRKDTKTGIHDCLNSVCLHFVENK